MIERSAPPGLFQSTTIVAVRKDGRGALAGDGQVTLAQHTVVKQKARKVRRLFHGKVVAGFAGGAADAFTLFERFEGKLQEHGGDLLRASVELAKMWRTDRALRRLEALMLVMDAGHMLLLSGSGDIIEPDDDVAAIGSGGPFALAAARALWEHSSLSARDIAVEALKIASRICVYTNDHISVEEV